MLLLLVNIVVLRGLLDGWCWLHDLILLLLLLVQLPWLLAVSMVVCVVSMTALLLLLSIRQARPPVPLSAAKCCLQRICAVPRLHCQRLLVLLLLVQLQLLPWLLPLLLLVLQALGRLTSHEGLLVGVWLHKVCRTEATHTDTQTYTQTYTQTHTCGVVVVKTTERHVVRHTSWGAGAHVRVGRGYACYWVRCQ